MAFPVLSYSHHLISVYVQLDNYILLFADNHNLPVFKKEPSKPRPVVLL